MFDGPEYVDQQEIDVIHWKKSNYCMYFVAKNCYIFDKTTALTNHNSTTFFCPAKTDTQILKKGKKNTN